MFLMNYFLMVVLVFLVFSVAMLSLVFVPYHGVIALMGVSFSCCVLMIILGRTFVGLVMYLVYLGGLVVVFSYCVSVEKDKFDVLGGVACKCLMAFFVSLFVVFLWFFYIGGVSGLSVYSDLEDLLCLEVNGGGVFYFDGGVGLLVCSWGLLVVLFSILVILGWSRLVGMRPF